MNSYQSDRQVLLRLEELIKGSKGRISPADASAATGYSLEQVKDGLSRLIDIYKAKVSADPQTGKLEFIFQYPLFKRGEKTLAEKLTSLGNTLYKIFKIIYKAAIGIILIFYAVVFIVMLAALMLAGKSKDTDNDRSDNTGGAIIAGIFRAVIEGFSWYVWTRPYHYASDSYGYRYKEYDTEKNKGQNFIRSVFAFVFGPDRPPADPLNDAKEALAYIRQKSNKLTSAKIIELSGGDFDTAEEKLAEYAVKFNGELKVNDQGIVIAEFYDMEKSGSGLPEGKIEYYKDEVEPPYELTGNSTGRNLGIAAINLFNLLMSFAVINSSSFQMQDGTSLDVPFWAVILLGYFPFLFSVSFFLMPVIRYPRLKAKQAQRINNIIRRRLTGAIIAMKGMPAAEKEIIGYAGIPDEYKEKARAVLSKLIGELQGEIRINENGAALICFERIEKEMIL